jgi:hypothetical protein
LIELREYKPNHNPTFFSVKGTSDSPKVQRLIELARDAELFQGDAPDVGQAAKASGGEPEVEVVIKGAGSQFLYRGNSAEFERQIQAKVFQALMGEFGG